MINFFIICLLVQPWIFLPIKDCSDQFRLPQGMFLLFTFMGLFALYFSNGAKAAYRNKYLSFLIGYVFLNIFFYFFAPFGIEKLVNNYTTRQVNFWALEPLLHFTFAVFGIYIILSSFEKLDYIRIAKAICVSATLIALWSILQYIGFDPYGKIAIYRCGNRVSACLDNPNLVGGYLALSVPLFFMFLRDKKFIVMFLLSLGGLYVSKCHFSQGIALLTILLYIPIKFKNKISFVFSGAISLLGILAILKFDYLKLSKDIGGRLICWKFAIEKVKDNVLFGQGLGIFKTWEFKTYGGGATASNAPHFPNEPFTLWFSVHNDWLQYVIEIGIIGMFLFSLVAINTLRKGSWKDEVGISYLLGFVSFLIMMFASFPIEVPVLALLGLVMFCGSEKI